MTTRAKYLLCWMALFIYGSLIHLLMFRTFVGWSFPPGTDRSVADDPLTNAAITVLGGAFVTAFMLPLLRRTWTQPSLRVLLVISKAAAFGVVATFLALQTFFVLGSFFFALKVEATTVAGPGDAGLLGLFLLCLIEVETSGLVLEFFSIPFAPCYGAIAGVFAVCLHRFFRSS